MLGGTRRRRTLIGLVSIVLATGVAVGGGGPVPGQEEPPPGPEVVYVDAYGPILLGYEDCDGVVHTEEDPLGWVDVELDYEVEAEVAVGISFSGDLADDLVDAPTEVVVPAGESWGEAEFTLGQVVAGELTVTVLPGDGYTTGPDDTTTLEVSDEPEVLGRCTDDLGDPPNDTDRQTIDVGERPVPIGFFDEEESDGGESTATTAPAEELPAELARVREQWATPAGFQTLVVNGSLPPGLTYERDEWGGAATTAGTYAFDIRLCLDQAAVRRDVGGLGGDRRPVPRALPDVICFGQVDVEIVVRAVTPPPSARPATPATPIDARARFTG